MTTAELIKRLQEVDPVYYYDNPDDEEDVPVTVVYIA